MKKKTFEKEEINEMIRLYTEEKMGTPSIGEIFKCHKLIINRTLRENDVTIDQSGRRNTGGKPAAAKRYYKNNKEILDEYYKGWRKGKLDNLKEYHTKWRDDNREHLRKMQNAYQKKRCAEDPKYRLATRTRTALYTCLKEFKVAKYRSTFDLLGYTLEELIIHLEKQFTEGMTWDNYGEWHVDHRIPMAKFNFTSTDDHEFKLCWCLDNLQPLWGEDNLIKGSRYLSI
jgi:hypothetical protein